MSDLDLIHQLGDRLGRPLEEISEGRFERYVQANYSRDSTNQDRINRDAYSLAENGAVSGLFLQPVTSQIMFDIPLYQFRQIRHLFLSKVNLPSFSFLKGLKGLTSLDLRNNRISDGSFLRELKGLTSLDLRNNRISDGSFLRELKGLTSLDLRKNGISDGSFLRELKGLTSLDLRNNSISDGSFLRELTGLTSLDLRNNSISDGSFLRELTGLTSLDLRNNSISDFSFLRELTGLTSLDLRSNIISDVSFLRELTGLTSLDLRSNRIKEIPQWLAAGRLAIETENEYASDCINLFENPIEEPPLEIVRQGNSAILNYYAQLAAQGKDHLYEAKMLIVGEGEAGKTTLAHKIPEPNCPLPHVDDRTRGISIRTHTFSCRNRDQADGEASRTFHLNIWDFGGQEIYHATHRFFLSRRSLYVLVADNRKDDTDFNYWLNIIERFADNSPLIIVLNEKGDIQRSLNRADLLSRYPDSIKEIVSVNFKTHEESDQPKAQDRLKAINTLIGHIEHCAQNLPHIGEPVPAHWVDVRHAIENDNRNHIYRDQFDDLCQAQDITASQDIDTLLGYFHDLGVLLHFADNPLLRDRVILKPAWATNAVYRIFDDDRIKAKAGRFSRQDCADIWRDPQYHRMHHVLIELMKNFRLVYEIGESGELVAPQLLPQNTPAYDWDEAHNSHMQLRYDAFMPKGVFWQFAVTMYRYIHNHDWVWRNGMVIRRGDTWAAVIEDLNLRRISLRFSGPSIAEFRAVIVDQLDKISQSYHKLHYDKMIPCNCEECKDNDRPHFFAFADLKKRQEQRKKNTIECVKSGDDILLSSLLEGYEVQTILETLPDKRGEEPTPPPPLQTNNPPPPQSQPTMQTIKIFLASSSELKADREQFEIFINRKNKETIKTGVFLELALWEDFFNAMSKTRSQDEYNKVISNCDVFVSLFYTKVGQYTEEEFTTALETFKTREKPLIYTYFKNAAINTKDITPEIITLLNFKKKLSDMEHFYQNYDGIDALIRQFGDQLVKFLPQLTGTDPNPPNQQ
ncbi:MAG: COR domain-containing protein [Leptolyngbyaceae cyanobacterium MO_188.B28]|nr:COR domain-containing protein [Leptolyngbyaceae cyanobacterium MO_188.B28]